MKFCRAFQIGPVLALAAILSTQASAAKPAIDLNRPCGDAFTVKDQSSLIIYVIWGDGFLSGRTGKVNPMTTADIRSRLATMKSACAANPRASVLQVIAATAGGRTPAGQQVATQGFPPTEAGARRLLRQFFQPGRDHAALTATLRPNSRDYRTIYKEPFATALEKTQAGMWQGKPSIRPKQGQSELLMFFATTSDLMTKKQVLDVFPGGYKQVVPHMKPGVPIVRFKFVKPGERLGLAFDGLVYVNGRWVIMPKPYRAL